MSEFAKLIDEDKENVQKFMGEILLSATAIESHLDYFISAHLFEKHNEKRDFFIEHFLLKTNFEKKIHLFKEICKNEKVNEDKVSRITKAMKNVQELRNKVAHSPLGSIIDGKLYFRKRTAVGPTEEFRVSQEEMQKFRETRKSIDAELISFYKGW